MPSANRKLEKQASTETVEPIRQAIIVIEHKIRNLEKRKGKLESYKYSASNGRELNVDQTRALSKYDGVTLSLEVARELYKQIDRIATDAVKQQKKLARKEAAERTQQEIEKVKEVLLTQNILLKLGNETVREDFKAGTNGASKLTDEEIKYLDDFYEVIVKQGEEGELTNVQQMQKVAEHYVAVTDGKQREIVGTTYNKLKEIITSINQSGYFNQVHSVQPVAEEITETVVETQVNDTTVPEQVTEEFNNSDRHIPPESIIPIPSFPVQVAPLPVVSGTAPVSGPIPVVPQPIPAHPAAPVEASYYTNATGFVPQPQQQQQQQAQPSQQQPPQAPRINDVIGTPNFFFLQESELDSPDVTSQTPIVSHIPSAVNAPIPTQTFTNQNFTNATVVPQQVIYPHQPPQDMSHIPGFANPNPPPPIPMPPSHQQPNIQYSPQHPAGFQQQPPASQQIPAQGQNFEQAPQQDGQEKHTEEKTEENQEESAPAEADEQPNEAAVDWSQITESGDYHQTETPSQSVMDSQQQQQTTQQAWSDQQRGGYRGRGSRRGNSNGNNGRGRGGYQQNGRGGQGTYYRNENYQNGYQQRSWSNNEGNGGYNTGFKRGGGSTRGGPRGERGMDRGGRGQYRGQRGGNRGAYVPRGKPQAQQ